MGRGWSCQLTRVRFLGFAPKNLLTHPIFKAQLDSFLVTGPSMCVDRLFLRDTGTVYGWGGGLEGFLGLCEKVLLSFVKMPWGSLSLTDQVFFFEASQEICWNLLEEGKKNKINSITDTRGVLPKTKRV